MQNNLHGHKMKLRDISGLWTLSRNVNCEVAGVFQTALPIIPHQRPWWLGVMGTVSQKPLESVAHPETRGLDASLLPGERHL